MMILLTGADGLLGSNLVRVLLDRGHKVRVFVYPSSKAKTLEGLNIEILKGDILDGPAVDKAVEGCEAVIHAAAMTNIWPARSPFIRRVNIEGTQNIIDAVLKHNVKRLIYVGSGSSVNTKPVEGEKYAFPGAKFGLDYIDSKYEALKLILNAFETRKLPVVSVLPTFMIGPYDTLPSSGQMILAVAQGKLKFYTGGGRNFIYVNDVATAIANGLTMGQPGKYYIACNENLSYKDFISKTAAITNKGMPWFKVPGWIVKTIGFLGTTMGNITGKQPLLTFPMARISCEKQFICADEAVKELNMPRTDIEVAIRECYDWFVKNDYLRK